MHYWLPVIAWTALIFSFSMQPYSAYLNPDSQLRSLITRYLQYPLHLGEFLFLYLLWTRALSTYEGAVWREHAWVWAFAVTVLTSVGDETIQLFTPTRTFSVLDLCMDVLGGVLGMGVVTYAPRHWAW